MAKLDAANTGVPLELTEAINGSLGGTNCRATHHKLSQLTAGGTMCFQTLLAPSHCIGTW